jgi:SAM-dependent methyltransferase
MKTIEQVENYWKNPDKRNDPRDYLKGEERTAYLVGVIKKIATQSDSILEIGCNVGRNLAGLYDAGFKDVAGIEINKSAVDILRRKFRRLDSCPVFIGPVESLIGGIKSGDIIYTMAVLEHIHPDVEKVVFSEMVRVAKKFIVIIEDETFTSSRHFPRDYKKIFTTLGCRETSAEKCTGIKGLGSGYVCRVFEVMG